MTRILPQLDQMAWHDTDVHSLHIGFSQRHSMLILDCYDEELGGCVRKEALFQEIDMLMVNLPALSEENICELEVYSLDVSRVGAFYQAHLMFLTTFGGPSTDVSF